MNHASRMRELLEQRDLAQQVVRAEERAEAAEAALAEEKAHADRTNACSLQVNKENERLRAALAASCVEEREQLYEAIHGGGCQRALAAEAALKEAREELWMLAEECREWAKRFDPEKTKRDWAIRDEFTRLAEKLDAIANARLPT